MSPLSRAVSFLPSADEEGSLMAGTRRAPAPPFLSLSLLLIWLVYFNLGMATACIFCFLLSHLRSPPLLCLLLPSQSGFNLQLGLTTVCIFFLLLLAVGSAMLGQAQVESPLHELQQKLAIAYTLTYPLELIDSTF